MLGVKTRFRSIWRENLSHPSNCQQLDDDRAELGLEVLGEDLGSRNLCPLSRAHGRPFWRCPDVPFSALRVVYASRPPRTPGCGKRGPASSERRLWDR